MAGGGGERAAGATCVDGVGASRRRPGLVHQRTRVCARRGSRRASRSCKGQRRTSRGADLHRDSRERSAPCRDHGGVLRRRNRAVPRQRRAAGAVRPRSWPDVELVTSARTSSVARCLAVGRALRRRSFVPDGFDTDAAKGRNVLRGGQELRPRHQRPAPRRARDLRVRRQQRGHPDLRDRGDRHVQEGSVRARPQRAPGRAPARPAPQRRRPRRSRSRWRTAARSASRCRRTRRRTRATTRARWTSGSSRSRSRSATTTRRRRRSSSPRTSTCASAATRSASHTVDFEPERISIDELYPGNRELLVPPGDDRRRSTRTARSSSTRRACTRTSS